MTPTAPPIVPCEQPLQRSYIVVPNGEPPDSVTIISPLVFSLVLKVLKSAITQGAHKSEAGSVKAGILGSTQNVEPQGIVLPLGMFAPVPASCPANTKLVGLQVIEQSVPGPLFWVKSIHPAPPLKFVTKII